MRLLIVEGAGDLWGSERALLDFVDRLPDTDVAVCCPPNRPLVGELRARGIRTYPYFVYRLHERSRWQRLRAAAGVLRACLRFQPDVIHLNEAGIYRVVLPAAVLLQRPMVAHVRLFEDACHLAERHPNRSRLRAIVAVSRAVEQEIRRYRTLDEIPVHALYDAYSSPRRAKPERTVADGVTRIACVGRLVPIKGQDLLLAAWPLVRRAHADSECLIVGDGDPAFVRRLQAHALEVGEDGTIRLTGFVPDVSGLLASCAVLVCPSHREPLGRVVLEAWDAGAVPVVFRDSGGAAEVVAAAKGGVLYEEETPESLAQALLSVLCLEPEATARLVHNGRVWMATQCDAAVYGNTLREVLATASVRA